MNFAKIIFCIITAFIAFFLCAVFFKYACIDKFSFLCWYATENAKVLREFQTLIAGMMALLIGYLNLRAIQKQTQTSQDLLYAQFTEERRAIINAVHSPISSYIQAIQEKLYNPIHRAGYGEGTLYKVAFPEKPTVLDDDSKFAKLKDEQFEIVKQIRTCIILLNQEINHGLPHLTQEKARILDERITPIINSIVEKMEKLKDSP